MSGGQLVLDGSAGTYVAVPPPYKGRGPRPQVPFVRVDRLDEKARKAVVPEKLRSQFEPVLHQEQRNQEAASPKIFHDLL